jgi:hypothetical protein
MSYRTSYRTKRPHRRAHCPYVVWPKAPNFGRRSHDIDWTTEAACAGLTEFFFSDDTDDAAAAADICTCCAVVAKCYEGRDLVSPNHGVWSGERRRPSRYGARAKRLARERGSQADSESATADALPA